MRKLNLLMTTALVIAGIMATGNFYHATEAEITAEEQVEMEPRDPFSKEITFEIKQDYEACAFDIKVEHKGSFSVSMRQENGKEEYTSEITDGDSCTINVKDVKEGKWKVRVTEIISEPENPDEFTEPDMTAELTVEEVIGKIQVSAKAIDKTTFSIGNVSVARDIVGLKEYFKDEAIVVEWDDASCGNVNVAVIDTKTSQILDKQTVSGRYYEFELPEQTEEITIDVVPATSAGITGANTQYTIKVENNPDATVTYEDRQYTNRDTVSVNIKTGDTYSLQFMVNGKEVKNTGSLEAGSYDYEIPVDEGKNEILTYVIDENHNMRSTGYSIIRDSIKPALTLDMEYDGLATYDNAIDITGTIKDYDTFTINEVEPVVAGDGSFKAEYILKDGENLLIVRATDIAGNETLYEATITKMIREYPPVLIILIPIGLIAIIGFFIYNKFFRKGEKMKKERPVKEKKEKMNKSGLKDWQKSLIILAGVGIVVYLILTKVLLWGVIPSESMYPTLEVGDYAINNGLAYVTHEPQRGDIVIFTGHEQNMNGETLIKRIIGVPGDSLMFVDGYVYVNGQIAYEEYLGEDIETNSAKDFEVPDGCYFVMGDNRENSLDSRFWDDPFVKRSEIKGKLITRIPVVRLKKTVSSLISSVLNYF